MKGGPGSRADQLCPIKGGAFATWPLSLGTPGAHTVFSLYE